MRTVILIDKFDNHITYSDYDYLRSNSPIVVNPKTDSTTTSTYDKSYYDWLESYKYDRMEALKLSRSWLRAPWKLHVFSRVILKLPVFCRRIAPPFWTGKNFKKR